MIVLLKRLANVLFTRVPVDAPLTCTGYNAAAYNQRFGRSIFEA